MAILRNLYKSLSPKYQNLYLDYRVNFSPRYGHGKPPHEGLFNIISEGRERYKDTLEKAFRYITQIQSIKKRGEEENSGMPAWNNGFLPGLDIIGIYTMLAEINPSHYVEVGSGTSTKVAYKSKNDNALKTEIISIDPYPRTEIDSLADKIIRQPFEDIDSDFLLSLEAGDILFIDNSHRILPNSDSLVFFLEVLPTLKKGVIVHLHDIYLPYDYPQDMCDRYYSEQYGLAMYLLANPEKFQILLPNYFISVDQELSMILDLFWKHPNLQGVERHGGSFWLEINQ
ncbi:MAG TPA: class I SAM-dependent methyltransferase [Bacteroides sp.]|nr:class I SAM-dependent methyltransferase [Bacteroides sp.]